MECLVRSWIQLRDGEKTRRTKKVDAMKYVNSGCSLLDWLHGCEMGAGAADNKSPSESHTSVHEKGDGNEIFAW